MAAAGRRPAARACCAMFSDPKLRVSDQIPSSQERRGGTRACAGRLAGDTSTFWPPAERPCSVTTEADGGVGSRHAVVMPAVSVGGTAPVATPGCPRDACAAAGRLAMETRD